MQATAAIRRLPLEGAVNVRDLGGYPMPDGGVTRWRSFLRSDGTQSLTARDIETLRDYGITDIVDLRSANECAEKPSALANGAPGIQYHQVNMLDNIMSGGKLPFPTTLGDLYISMLDNGGADFVKVMNIFAAARGGCLFHCAVGKDRTGMTAMLLLKLAMVANPDVVADYAVSEIYLQKFIAPQVAVFEKEGIPTKLLGSDSANMATALDYLAEKYGTAESFLLQSGLGREELAAVKAKICG